mmetsp:Transcript_120580/g.257517  ORF Transcript_120580/g.257517 Transcript_120580/m.257517 type:complete len:385 (-) Transcript_120580:71-1225(-)
MTSTGSAFLKVTESEALIESSFRRLLASIESEREKIRSTWAQIEDESSNTTNELSRLKQDTQEWCQAERNKIQNEWKRLDKLREKMSVLQPCDKSEVLKINCCGTYFELPKASLCNIEGSYLNHMFSEAFVQNIPTDHEGNFFLDFNPFCFDIIVKYLITLQARPDSSIPPIPPEQQQNMDLLVESLKLKPFLRMNAIMPRHATSLRVSGLVVEATHSGWQVISAERPLPMSGASYFEVTVLANPDQKKGGLAFGVCGHIPTGQEIHSIRFPRAVTYSSHNGLVGEDIAVENVAKGIKLVEGSVFGIKHDVHARTLQWFHNRVLLGVCSLKPESLERMRVLYPVFALYTPGQKIQVDFSATSPAHSRTKKSTAPGAGVGALPAP